MSLALTEKIVVKSIRVNRMVIEHPELQATDKLERAFRHLEYYTGGKEGIDDGCFIRCFVDSMGICLVTLIYCEQHEMGRFEQRFIAVLTNECVYNWKVAMFEIE